MDKQEEVIVEKLAEKDFISEAQHREVKEYNDLGIFSLNTELLFLMYLSVLLFTGGVGTLVYKNIDSIGHITILAVNFSLMLVCFYFSFKRAKGFSKEGVLFDNPIYDYVVLTGSILGCIFIGYLQYQFAVFGNDFGLVSLMSAAFCFAFAYYFDSRMVLSMGITALTAFVGITLTPKTVFENEIYSNPTLSYYGVALGVLIILWTIYSLRSNLKKHFHFVYYTFAQHLIGLSSIAGLLETYWVAFIPVMAGGVYYFYRIGHQLKAVSFFVFSLVYGYIGLNILLYKFIEYVDSADLYQFAMMLSPVYVVGSILLFIKLVRNFNKKRNDSIR
ncbi:MULTISPECIES: DUF2157 domain-containing protein [Flavobacterium]|uniref:DUF2157 domain-containing protein n=1 Tax=Flavobacterium TaxID=237 RepID=UPI001FCB4BD1|nr:MULTISPECIES: DUF2157 domain-containing protein [Flavobacterium]UOK43099.1 DUF2157 domain-containing protein [Flavobacterium enshiense]